MNWRAGNRSCLPNPTGARGSVHAPTSFCGLHSGAVYRALHRLEANGYVTSSWDTSGSGPARRLCTLTPSGYEHLAEWVDVMGEIASSLGSLVKASRRALSGSKAAALA